MDIHKLTKKLLTFRVIANSNLNFKNVNINSDSKKLNNLDKNRIEDAIVSATINCIVQEIITENSVIPIKKIIKILEAIKEKYLEFMNENQINFYIKIQKIFKKNEEWTIEDIWNINKYIICEQTDFKNFPEENLNKISKEAIENLRIMTERSINWFSKLNESPIVGLEIYSKNKFLETIIDFISEDSIINIEINEDKLILKTQWIKLIIYLILGKLERNPMFFKIKKLIVLNPRSDIYHVLEIKNIPNQLMSFIEDRIKILDYSEEINI